MRLTELSTLFLDGQTTGLSANQSELLELGWSVSFGHGEARSQLIRPSQIEKVPAAIWRVTGLAEKDFAEAADAEAAWRQVVESARSANCAALVIHYAQFEKPFLLALHRKVFGEDALPWPLVDTYKIAQRVCPNFPSKTVRALSGHWGFVLPESNRARDHVLATQIIWKNLIPLLANEGVTTFPLLQEWLAKKTSAPKAKAKAKSVRLYLFSREKRLALPAGPGIYEMFSSAGQILYVGKATSLRSRVNSYFTQRRTTRTRLHELMTQVADIRVTATPTALEAAILENDRIKEIGPRYNVSLRPSAKPVLNDTLESVQQLQAAATEDWEKVKVEWLQYPIEELHAKLCELCEAHGLNAKAVTVPQLLRLGKKLLPFEGPPEELDEIGASVHRKLKRAVRAIHRTRWLNELSCCFVAWRVPSGEWRCLTFEGGELTNAVTAAAPEFNLAVRRGPRGQSPLDRKQLDRVRILLTELTLFAKKGIPFEVRFSKTRRFSLSAPPNWLSRAAKPLPEVPPGEGAGEISNIADGAENSVELTTP